MITGINNLLSKAFGKKAGEAGASCQQRSGIEAKASPAFRNNVVYDPSHTPKELGDKIAQGGEGSIWTLKSPKLAGIVVKLFHDHKLRETQYLNEVMQKTIGMSAMRIQDEWLGWPLFPVYGNHRQYIGFAMRRVEGKELLTVMHPLSSNEICKDWDRSDYVRLGLDFVAKIKKLHERGIVLGDINPRNFLVQLSSRSLRFIDTDSYQVSIGGQTFRCTVGTPDYTPPEYQGRDFKSFDRTKESDFFSVAVMVFQLLMRGKHPFDIVGGAGPVQNIKRGLFPYGTNQGRLVPKGNWIFLWSHLPKRMKDMFHHAFIDGVNKPLTRPNLDNWTDVLKMYLWDASKGWHNMSLAPREFKSAAYHGKRAIA